MLNQGRHKIQGKISIVSSSKKEFEPKLCRKVYSIQFDWASTIKYTTVPNHAPYDGLVL